LVFLTSGKPIFHGLEIVTLYQFVDVNKLVENHGFFVEAPAFTIFLTSGKLQITSWIKASFIDLLASVNR